MIRWTTALRAATLLWILGAVDGQSADFVWVVDTSGSMREPISRQDRRIRVTTVQEALDRHLDALPDGSRLTLISFNTGITSERELILRAPADRQQARDWVAGLVHETQQNGTTHLWRALRRALEVASGYARQNPNDWILVRVLTDGEDNDPKYRRKGSGDVLDELVREFPLVDGETIRPSLVLLGDLEMEVRGPFRKISDPEITRVQPPLIRAEPANPRVGQEVRFSDSSPNAYALYDWWVDGSQLSREKTATHRFDGAGRHSVRLQVTDAEGQKDDAEQTIEVSEPERPPPLAPSFAFVPGTPAPGEVVRLSGRASAPNLQYAWQVGGRDVAQGPEAEWKPDREGEFAMTLVVRDATGRSEQTSRNIRVAEPPLAVSFTALREALSGQAVQFVNETPGRVGSWAWNFGDGSPPSNERNPVHAFTNKTAGPLTYRVKLEARSPAGRTFASAPQEITIAPEPPVIPPPVAAFRVLTEDPQAGQSIGLVDESTGLVDSYAWDFNGETISQQKNPAVVFETPGDKAVRLTVRGPGGSHQAVQPLRVAPRDLSIQFNWLDTNGVAQAMPSGLNFGTAPRAVVQAGDLRVDFPDEFELIVPRGLPAGGAAVVAIENQSGNAFELHRREGGEYRAATPPVRVTMATRFRVAVRPEAGEGEHTAQLTVRPAGDRVQVNGQAQAAVVPVSIRVGRPSVPVGLLALLGALAVGGFAWVIHRLVRKRGFPPDKPVVVTLEEVHPAKRSPAGDEDGLRAPEEFTLAVGDFVGLGGGARNAYDLNKHRASIVRQEDGFVLELGEGGAERRLSEGRTVEFEDDAGRRRAVKAAYRPAAGEDPAAQA